MLKKPFVIFRAGKQSVLKSCALLAVCALLLALSVEIYRRPAEEQGSMEVFAGEARPSPRPQGLYAFLERLFGDS